MRSVMWKGATVAMIVMASGAAAGQNQPRSVPAILIAPSREQIVRTQTVFNPQAIAHRIWSFDANKDGRIARDEMPERMEGLLSRGDKNNDGFLNVDEVAALIPTSTPPRRIERFTPRGATTLAEIIADLKLPPATHDRAIAIANQDSASRQIDGRVGDDLEAEMRKLLGDEDYENFVAAAARLRNTSPIVGGIVGGFVTNPAPPRP